jgi:hypothetical protein
LEVPTLFQGAASAIFIVQVGVPDRWDVEDENEDEDREL